MIARDGENLTPEEARDVLGGFVLVNDFSARDVQFRDSPLLGILSVLRATPNGASAMRTWPRNG